MLWDFLTVNEMKGAHRSVLTTAPDSPMNASGLGVDYVPCALGGANGEVQLGKLAV